MAWAILLASAVLEAVWATALGASDGLTRPGPTMLFLVTTTLSLVGLGRAMKQIPIGTAYAVWTGLGAALTVTWAAATGSEPLTPLRSLFLVGIIACAVGLKMTTAPPETTSGAPAPH